MLFSVLKTYIQFLLFPWSLFLADVADNILSRIDCTKANESQPLSIVVRRPLLQQHIRREPPHRDAIQPAELSGERTEAAVRVECLRECGVQGQRRRRGQRPAGTFRRYVPQCTVLIALMRFTLRHFMTNQIF